MRFDNEGFEAKHAEIHEAINYFLKAQLALGMLPYTANEFGRLINEFFSFIPAFLKTEQCSSCKGLGTSNLVALGAKTPKPCSECGGSGRVKKSAITT